MPAAVITGASQGIGRACALTLAAEGATVAAAARNQEKLTELAAQITANGGKAAAFPLDVADEEQVVLLVVDEQRIVRLAAVDRNELEFQVPIQ